MKHENEVSVGRNHLQVSYPVVISSLISVVVAAFAVAGSYFHVIYKLDAMAANQVTVPMFQGWVDGLRDSNEKLPLKVPAVPHLGNREAEILERRPLARMKP